MQDKEINLNELIVVESLPKIKQQLEIISEEVDKEIKWALSLDFTEENKVEIKKARARLNNIKNVLEEKRVEIKKAILQPYNEFENIYNDLVKNKLNEVENTLKKQINSIEAQQLQEKETEIRVFAEQYIKHLNLDFVKYEDINIKITLSASMKSLKEKVNEWCDRVKTDTLVIEDLPNRDEIMYEYKKNGYNLTNAIQVANERLKELEKIKETNNDIEQKENIDKQNEEQIDVELEELIPPTPIVKDEEDTKFLVNFRIVATKSKIKKLKEFLEEEGIDYE